MLTREEVVQDQRYRRVLIATVLVIAAAISGFEIGRTTAETSLTSHTSVAEQVAARMPRLGPMSESDRTRYEVHRKMNRIGPLHPGG
jgi:hypothetical protein